MASSSNLSSALVTSSRRNYYDVFVTFRGEDTRNNFTDFLFDALETKGVFVFRDNTNLQKGESIGPELLRAIEGSQVFVAVFSRYYASSTWCLEELEKICECVQVPGKHLLPVFYDVDPSEVRKQSGNYCEAFVKHEQRFQQDPQKVSRWRKALNHVGSISGWDVRDKPQAGEIKKIVQEIMNILKCESSCVSKDLVGLYSSIEALQNHLLLDSADVVRAIGICGMAGIGKTTLAMTLYDQISHRFSVSCFIDDVSKTYRLCDGPLDAQKQILLQTVGMKHHQICNHYNITNLIRRRLCRERALLILDNVDQGEQLEKIAVRREWLGAGSRIIIISRDEHIMKDYGVDVVYKVPLLSWIDSCKLFCLRSFKVEKIIMSSYHNVAYEILNYAQGLPLAIKLLGSFLFGRNVTEWKSALARLREGRDNDVMDVLELSFDGLNHMEKEIFLDIACFFNFQREEYVKNILNCCGFHAHIGLRVLIDKSFICIEGTQIKMHSLFEELGRKIVQESSSKEKRKWSRVWSVKQLYNVKMEKMEKHVQAIVLNSGYDGGEVDVEHLSKMSNLRLLVISCSKNIFGIPNELVELRYVELKDYPFKNLPSGIPNELVDLVLRGSSIKQLWKNKKYLPKLRRLDLSYSYYLEKITDLGEFPNLEWLNLEGCIHLVELDQSIGHLRKLVYLNLVSCINLVSVPNNIFGLSSLEDLKMRGCCKVFNNPRNLKKHDLDMVMPHQISLPTATTNTYLLPSLHRLFSLCNVDISFCHLSQLPDSIECLCSLERLNLGGNSFVTLPSLRKLSKLVHLNLEHCTLLESFPQLPFPTTVGRDHPENNCGQYEIFRNITGLVIFNCPKLAESERERCSSITFSWLMQFIQANPFYFEGIHIVSPGSEIPSWINNQSMGGSINVSPIMHDNDNNIIGIVCCVVFSMAPQVSAMMDTQAHVMIEAKSFWGMYTYTPVFILRSLIRTKSCHLWIIYFPRESYHEFGKIRFEINGDEGLGMEVKSCGYRWVCKQDLQEFNLPMMNHENSLAQKCKILAIEDETQQQPQSEQESFISQVITTSQTKKSRTSISAPQTEVSVEVPDSPVSCEVSTESPQKKISILHIIGRFIGRFLNNCCQQTSTDTDTGYDTDTVNSDAESLVSEEDLDAVSSIIEEAIQTDIATSNVETDSPVEVAEWKKFCLLLRPIFTKVELFKVLWKINNQKLRVAENSIIEEAIQTDIATSNVETDPPVEVAERKKFRLLLRTTFTKVELIKMLWKINNQKLRVERKHL